MLRLVLLAATLAAATPAHAFFSSNQMRVEATGPVTFSVSARGGNLGATDFWCAAGEYADRRLRASGSSRIWRLSEPPRRGGQPVVFSLDPTGKASRSGLVVLGPDDGSLSVAAARNQCEVTRMMNRRF